jgi:O-acetylhomoserine/O-acetylserine sulfhydrylase-like pyridoxal-dependent enzyme
MLLTDDAETVMSRLKQNFGNTTAVMNQLQKDINFPDVHDFSQFLRFSNLVENITATVITFGDENEANHKQILRKLMNKLPDFLKMLFTPRSTTSIAETHVGIKPFIGQGNCSLTLTKEVIQRNQHNPVLSKTELGWVG